MAAAACPVPVLVELATPHGCCQDLVAPARGAAGLTPVGRLGTVVVAALALAQVDHQAG